MGKRFFFVPMHLELFWNLYSFLFNQKTAVIYSGLKQPRHEADHLLPSSVEDNEWNYTSNPL